MLDSTRQFQVSRSIAATWLAAIAFFLVLVFGWIHTKSVTEQQLREYTLAFAQGTAEQTALAFDTARNTLQDLTDAVSTSDAGAEFSPQARIQLDELIDRIRKRNPNLMSIAIVDANGRLVVGGSPSQATALRQEMATQARPLFPTGPHELVAMSAPFRDMNGGTWIVQLKSRLVDVHGFTAATISANYDIGNSFAGFANGIPLGINDSVALYDLNDNQLASLPKSGAVSNSTGEAAISREGDSIHYVATGEQVQLIARHKLQGYPFYVVFSKNMDAWLLKWRQEQFVLALAALGALVVTAAITTGIQRRLALTGQLQRTRGELEESNAALRATLAAAELLAARDQLTGLCNRRNFDQRLESAIARCTRHGDEFSLLMIDIDHFKNINDYYGHGTGDDVLRRFGEVLRERLRQNDVAARWGGEEFAVLADGACMENARLLAEQIREWIAVTTFPPVPRVTVSVGVAEYQSGESGDDLLKRADRALYNAKRNGRNRVMAAESGTAANVVNIQSA